ncbi:hypothetical protein A8B78_06040 [Jannaschia sp. EhC01]|nr:hypothetical protein A8B78_06040 [Jannaschia sp. EhC01]
MRPVDTAQDLVIFPKPIGLRLVLTAIGTIALGAVGLWFALEPFNWLMAVLSGGLGLLGVWMTWAFTVKRAKGNPAPAMMLSPQGLHLLTGVTGVVPWGSINGLGSYNTRGGTGLVINIDKAALAALDQSSVFKAARKFDAAIGVHALIFFQQQVEVPLHDLADMLHDYSVAHGGPPLQPNRHD